MDNFPPAFWFESVLKLVTGGRVVFQKVVTKRAKGIVPGFALPLFAAWASVFPWDSSLAHSAVLRGGHGMPCLYLWFFSPQGGGWQTQPPAISPSLVTSRGLTALPYFTGFPVFLPCSFLELQHSSVYISQKIQVQQARRAWKQGETA